MTMPLFLALLLHVSFSFARGNDGQPIVHSMTFNLTSEKQLLQGSSNMNTSTFESLKTNASSRFKRAVCTSDSDCPSNGVCVLEDSECKCKIAFRQDSDQCVKKDCTESDTAACGTNAAEYSCSEGTCKCTSNLSPDKYGVTCEPKLSKTHVNMRSIEVKEGIFNLDKFYTVAILWFIAFIAVVLVIGCVIACCIYYFIRQNDRPRMIQGRVLSTRTGSSATSTGNTSKN